MINAKNDATNKVKYINDCRADPNTEESTEDDKRRENVGMAIIRINGWPAVIIFGGRHIDIGEELYMDYGYEFNPSTPTRMQGTGERMTMESGDDDKEDAESEEGKENEGNRKTNEDEEAEDSEADKDEEPANGDGSEVDCDAAEKDEDEGESEWAKRVLQKEKRTKPQSKITTKT